MKITKTLILSFTLLAISFLTEARKPAVEDFVGVETEYYQETPQGTEVLFNFGNHIKMTANEGQSSQGMSPPYIGITVLIAFILLPAFIWVGLTRTVQVPSQSENFMVDATPNFDNNVVDLSSHRESESKEFEEKENKKAS